MDNVTILWLFIIFFMIHEFEEMIFLNDFIRRNMIYLEKIIPRRIYNSINSHLNNSVEQFTFAVFEEFVLLSLIIYICIFNSYFSFFIAIVICYVIHIFIHIIQSIYIKKYIPAVGSGIVSVIYSVWCILTLNMQKLILWKSVVTFIPIVVVAIVLNLKFALFLGGKVVKRE